MDLKQVWFMLTSRIRPDWLHGGKIWSVSWMFEACQARIPKGEQHSEPERRKQAGIFYFFFWVGPEYIFYSTRKTFTFVKPHVRPGFNQVCVSSARSALTFANRQNRLSASEEHPSFGEVQFFCFLLFFFLFLRLNTPLYEFWYWKSSLHTAVVS